MMSSDRGTPPHRWSIASGPIALSLSLGLAFAAPVAAQDTSHHATVDSAQIAAQAACTKLKAYGRRIAIDTIEAMAKNGTLIQQDSNANGTTVNIPQLKLDPATMPDSIRSAAITAGSSCNALPTPLAIGQMALGQAMNLPHAVLGVQLRPLTARDTAGLGLSDTHGVVVQGVTPGYGAASAGIVKGDVIVAFDGKSVASMKEARQQARWWKAGQVVSIEVVRQGGTHQKMDATIKMNK